MPIAEARSGLPLHRAQRQPERRVHDAARDQEQHEQHDEAVDVGGLAEDIEGEVAEHRLHHDALQAVGAAGDLEPVRDLAQHQRDAERHHQAREVGAAQHQEAGDEAERGRGEARGQQRQHRLLDDPVLGENSRHIGAEAEEGRVAERHDAGIAEDQVEREREQAEDRDLGQDQVLARQQEDAGEGGEPERDFEQAPARPRGEDARGLLGGRAVCGVHAHLATARENRPCGRQISTTIMMM